MTDGLVSQEQGHVKGAVAAATDRDGVSDEVLSDRPRESGRPREAAPAAGPGKASGKDPLLDLIRIAAIGRVVLWHTWAWAWLTWIPAMPAMFFVTGALLEGSVARHGWFSTLRSRLRRLLIPYWVYAACAWLVMWIDGWRPTAGDGLKWLLPLADPVGSADLTGLWVPLWYLRAYLWFLLAAGVLAAVWRRIGLWSVALASAAAAGLWFAERDGVIDLAGSWGDTTSLIIGDSLTYLPFVLAGMGYWATRRLPSPRVLLPAGAVAAVAAVVVWQRWGPEDAVVNRSYLLTLLVGAAGVALVFGARNWLMPRVDRFSGPIGRLNSRALTIYLWHGFGLVAAERLVHVRMDPGPLRSALALAVVLAVVAGAVVLFGPIEDLAAGRRSLGRLRDRVRMPSRWSVAVVPAVVLLVAALVLEVPAGVQLEGPLSGQAVVTRGALIEEQLDGRGPAQVDVSGMGPQEVLDDWVAEHRSLLDDLGAEWVDAAVVTPSGEVVEIAWRGTGEPQEEVIAWWSMTKTVTSVWLVQLVDEGVVELDDPLSDYVDHTPRAEDMTLRQLASHTSGIPPELDGDLMVANPAEEIETFVEQGDLAFEPGTDYGYSRVGYYLLALALERASGQAYTEAVTEMADQAGAEILFDDWLAFEAEVSDPDGHGYRGGLWSAGGLISPVPDGAALLHWIFTDGLSDSAVDSMTTFPYEEDRRYYGLGLVPLCPCETDGDILSAERFGLDTASGTFAIDGETGAAVLLRPHEWWGDGGPRAEFYDLEQRLLDSVTE